MEFSKGIVAEHHIRMSPPFWFSALCIGQGTGHFVLTLLCASCLADFIILKLVCLLRKYADKHNV